MKFRRVAKQKFSFNGRYATFSVIYLPLMSERKKEVESEFEVEVGLRARKKT